MIHQLKCAQCGADFEHGDGPGRYPVTCSRDCAELRRRAQTRASEKRNRERARRERLREQEEKIQARIDAEVEARLAAILAQARPRQAVAA